MILKVKQPSKTKAFIRGKLPILHKEFKGGIRAALFQCGFILKKTMKDGMERQPKTGVTYIRKGRRKRASSGGQYAGIVTGETIRSIDYTIKGSSELEFGIRNRSGKSRDVPKFLEEGTRNIEPRPSLQLTNQAREKDMQVFLRKMPYKAVVE